MNKYLSRNKVYDRLPPSKDAKKVYIFCEGQHDEINYFNYFRGFSSNIDIIPIPNENGKSDPHKLQELAKKEFGGNTDEVPIYQLDPEQHDEIWFVIDTDEWNVGDKINSLRQFCEAKNKSNNYNIWNVAQSNPCLEIWFYYHFYSRRPTNKEVSAFASMKDFVNNKIPGGFDSRSMPIEIETAIRNSRGVYTESNNQPDKYCTELFKLGDVILPFIEKQIHDILKGNIV